MCLLCRGDLVVALIFRGRPFFPGDMASTEWMVETDEAAECIDAELVEDEVRDIVE